MDIENPRQSDQQIASTESGAPLSVHPADRPAEPEHPMMLDGGFAPGDVELMVRCMAEELLQVGVGYDELIAMSSDPNYQALYSARATLGESRMDEILQQTHRRIGTFRHRTIEHTGDVQGATLTVKVS